MDWRHLLFNMASTVLEDPQALITNGTAPRRVRVIHYPTGDGKPVAETVEHREAIFYAIHAAQQALAGNPDVWISGNDFVYYTKDAPAKRVSPDCYIVLGVPQKERRSYKTWEENDTMPDVVWEFTSSKTAKEDRNDKFTLYEKTLQVPEYFLFDPLDQYLKPRLQGYRLVRGLYQAIAPDEDGYLVSQRTGIKMFADSKLLRFIHPQTGQVIPTFDEMTALHEKAEQEAIRQRELKEAAQDEIARLRAELERLRGGNPSNG